MRKIIFFELNEVPRRVIDHFVNRYPQSAFSEFYQKATIAETITPDTGWLHPWCTWPTLHRGVEAEKHTISNLSQNLSEIDEEYPPLWTLLTDAGISVGIAGSLHSWPLPERRDNYKFYLPDTFAAGPQAFPGELAIFQEFNLKMVDQSARNVSKNLLSRELFGMVPSLPKLGIGSSSIKKILSQLYAEKRNPTLRSRRRVFQGILAFDIYFKQLCKTEPAFSTFFSNHVASSMHRYWAATFPEDFQSCEFSEDWRERYSGEIDFAMHEASFMLEKLISFSRSHPEYFIIVTTSMGQAAFSGKRIARQVYVKNPSRFMKLFSLEGLEWSKRRVMLPRFAITTVPRASQRIRALVPTIKIANKPILHEEAEGDFHMFKFGMEDIPRSDEFIMIGDHKMTFAEAGLENTTIQDETGSSGYHIPEGMLLCFDPQRERKMSILEKVDTREICPAILHNYGLIPPKNMRQTSTSLFPVQC